MTKGLGLIKACLVTVSLSFTMGAWAIFARNDSWQLSPPRQQRIRSAPQAVVQPLDLPPITALAPSPVSSARFANGPGDSALDLPPVPTLSTPAPLPPIPVVRAPGRPLTPIARTRSSR
jgi:hypothetical protein